MKLPFLRNQAWSLGLKAKINQTLKNGDFINKTKIKVTLFYWLNVLNYL